MVEINLINNDFTQTGNICVITSYGIIIEHYLKKKKTVRDVISSFANFFPGLQTSISKRIRLTKGKSNPKFEREELIYKEFIDYCVKNNDKRGFELIEYLHNNDKLKTKQFCEILDSKFDKMLLLVNDSLRLRTQLLEGGLAMVLYPTVSGSHAIVVGYDSKSKKYFKRDPNVVEIEWEDFLISNQISEFIWFSNSPSLLTKYNTKIIY